MSAGPLSVTVTPGSTAPVPSVAFPKISPVLTCAHAGAIPISNERHTSTPARRSAPLIHPPEGRVGPVPQDLQTKRCLNPRIRGNGQGPLQEDISAFKLMQLLWASISR